LSLVADVLATWLMFYRRRALAPSPVWNARFDPVTVQDRATYERPNQTSIGMRHVLVNGKFVIRDGALDTKAFPGRAVRRAA
jgi:hypothetical protein